MINEQFLCQGKKYINLSFDFIYGGSNHSKVLDGPTRLEQAAEANKLDGVHPLARRHHELLLIKLPKVKTVKGNGDHSEVRDKFCSNFQNMLIRSL